MSNDSKIIGVKVSSDFHERVNNHAESLGVSMSKFVRDAIERRLNGDKPELNEQIKVKDEQIDRLHQLLAMAQSTTDKLTEQNQALTQQNQLLLEDLRQKRRWYHRLLAWNGS